MVSTPNGVDCFRNVPQGFRNVSVSHEQGDPLFPSFDGVGSAPLIQSSDSLRLASPGPWRT